jgi:magnesium transporter
MRRLVIVRDGVAQPSHGDDEIGPALDDSRSLLWLDVQNPSDEDLDCLRDRFQFHPLAIEDAMPGAWRNRRAKVDQYAGYSVIVLFDLMLRDESQRVHGSVVTLYVGRNFVVTAHQSAIRSLDELRERISNEPEMLKTYPLSLLIYQIADGLVDDYFPIVDKFDERLGDMEEKLFEGSGRGSLQSIFEIRKSLILMRRLTGQMRDVFNVLSRREQPFFAEGTVPYYTDVYDHLLRLSDTLDLQRDLLTGALESFLSIQSNELNQTVRTLTSVTVIVMVPTLIAGIYGMNFTHMPELDWTYGYPVALGAMLALMGGLVAYFRKLGWL